MLALISIFIFYVIWIFKTVYIEYFVVLNKIKSDHIKYILENNFMSNSYAIDINSKSVFVFKKEFRYEKIFCIKSLFSANANLGIYEAIVNKINLDFGLTDPVFANSSFSSSPIVQRINLNEVFSNVIESNVNSNINVLSNSDTVSNNITSINNNRNSLRLNTSIITNSPKNKELLNYNSNILYLIINKVSPSYY